MDQIRRAIKRDFFTVPNAIFNLNISSYAKTAYVFLCRCADDEGQAFPSYSTVGIRCSFSRRTALRAIEELREIGLLSVERRVATKEGKIVNTSNLYLLHEPQDDQGGDRQSPVPHSHQCPTVTSAPQSLVPDSHQGGDSQSPIIIPIEQYPLNNHGETPRGDQAHAIPPMGEPDVEGTVSREPGRTAKAEVRDRPPKTPTGFDEFWAAYPKKVAKQYAQAEWGCISPDSELRARIMACLARDKDSRQWVAENGRYIPKPENWLSQRRWEQQPETTQEMIDAKYASECDIIEIRRQKGRAQGSRADPPEEVSPEALLEGFEAFWAAYPNKVDRDDALKAWMQLSPGKELRSHMMSVLAKHKETSRWKYANGAYIARPFVWIDQRMWDNPRFLE